MDVEIQKILTYGFCDFTDCPFYHRGCGFLTRRSVVGIIQYKGKPGAGRGTGGMAMDGRQRKRHPVRKALMVVLCLALVSCGTLALWRQYDLPVQESTGELGAADSSAAGQSAAPQSGPAESAASSAPQPTEDAGVFGADAERKAEERLKSMTLAEKVGQLFIARCPGTGAKEQIASLHPAGYVLFGEDFAGKTAEQVAAQIGSYQSASAVPMMIGVDEEGGTVVRVSKYTALAPHRFQSPQTLYQNGGMGAITQDAREKSQLLLNLGINWNLAPVADVSTDPADFIYDRAFGKSAEETADYVRQVVKAMREEGISSTLKHFPGYGNNEDTHTGLAYDDRPYESFTGADFLPFRAGIEAGAPTVLVSHNIVSAIDPDAPASLSKKVHAALRTELGFTGVIMTDDLGMEAIRQFTGGADPCVQALLAGNDILLTSDLEGGHAAVMAAVQDGSVPESLVDTAVKRVLAWKYSTGMEF